ncbi:CARDB domain-containing protein [Natrialbaceae archaeon A-arb3/5]
MPTVETVDPTAVTVSQGEDVALDVTVVNNGDEEIASTTVELYRSGADNEADDPVAQQQVDTLDAWARETVTVTLETDAFDPGTHEFDVEPTIDTQRTVTVTVTERSPSESDTAAGDGS